MGREKLAFFHILCALGCWIGYFQHKGEETDGD